MNFLPAVTDNYSFVQRLIPPDPQHWLKNITLRVIEGFLRWYLEGHNVVYQSTFLVFARYFRIHWCREMHREFPYDTGRQMTKVSTTLFESRFQ
jgi:hypothetical protein